jgi:hypothetical protein
LSSMDANCNLYVNYNYFGSGTAMKSYIKKYTNTLNIPQSILDLETIEIKVAQSDASVVFESPELMDAIRVYSISGQLLSTIQSKNIKAEIQTSIFAKGIYIFKIQTKKGVAVHKMSL